MPFEPSSPLRNVPAAGNKGLITAALLAIFAALSAVDPVLASGSTALTFAIVALDRLIPRRRHCNDSSVISRRHDPFQATG